MCQGLNENLERMNGSPVEAYSYIYNEKNLISTVGLGVSGGPFYNCLD